MTSGKRFPMHGPETEECVRPGCLSPQSPGTPRTGRCYDHIVVTVPENPGLPFGQAFPEGSPVPEGTPFRYVDESGSTIEAYVLPLGTASRTDGPAVIEWDNEGWLTDEDFFVGGYDHRIDGPAEVVYEGGTVSYVRYARGGKDHRIDGPSYVEWNHDVAQFVNFTFRGINHPSLAGVGEALLALDDTAIRFEIATSSFAVLLDEGMPPRPIAKAIAAGATTVAGIREVRAGAPGEWVRSWEEGDRDENYAALRASISPSNPDGHRLRRA